MCGAVPLYLSTGFIIEEGFPVSDLRKIGESIKQAADEANVMIVTGDTKVVQKNAADKIFINTSGVGIIQENVLLSAKYARPGDRIIVNGYISDHGVTILTQREGFALDSAVSSDTAPLNHMVREIIEAGNEIHVLRDPTRGGVATALNEIAEKAKVGIILNETKLPIRDETLGACELLGLDPLYLANEGKLLAFVAPNDSKRALDIIRAHSYGQNAAIIGEVISENPGKVFMKTRIGGTRMIDMLAGEPLPRIC
jgi:hydrogenase expression/formation protein HypE